MNRSERIEWLLNTLPNEIVILDGGMGTMIQGAGLGESDYRGSRFADYAQDLKGNKATPSPLRLWPTALV